VADGDFIHSEEEEEDYVSVTKKKLFSLIKLPCDSEVRGHCVCKELPVIPINREVDKKRKIGNNGEPRRRRGTRGC
jgi:hypothetical protein